MRWGQKKVVYGHPKWHLFDGDKAVCGTWEVGEGRWVPDPETFEWLPADRRPALARNNVCAQCKKAYLQTRPDLKGYIDRLNDKKDV